MKTMHYCKILCECNDLIKPISLDQLYGGYKTILSKSTSLETFNISHGEIHSSVIQGLVENRSIKNLIAHKKHFSSILSNVLSKNRIIRNLCVIFPDDTPNNIQPTLDALKLLIQLNIELNNLTLMINENQLNSILDFVNNSLPIKELLLDATSTNI